MINKRSNLSTKLNAFITLSGYKKMHAARKAKNIFSMKFIDALAAGKAKGKRWEK